MPELAGDAAGWGGRSLCLRTLEACDKRKYNRRSLGDSAT